MSSPGSYCSSCGAAASGAFCSSCGASIATPQPPPTVPPPGYAAQPGYAPQPQGYAASATFGFQAPRRTSGLAIGALVAAFVFAPAGLILGVMARKEIARTGDDGDGLATAAIVISIAVMVIWVIAFAAIISTTNSISNGPSPGFP